jgi:hypothetical protein
LVDSTGGWFFPTYYSYNNDSLVTYDYTVIGGSDGTSQVHTEVSYEDTSVTRTAFRDGEIFWRKIYTFMSTDYKCLIRKEAILAPNVGINNLYEYVYNANGYPTEKMRIDESGEQIYNMVFSYY